jgi:hypothetical protein
MFNEDPQSTPRHRPAMHVQQVDALVVAEEIRL